MRRRITRKKTNPAPIPAPVVVEQTEPEIIGEDIMPFILRHEDEIIDYIKDKATKATLTSLAPLLEKLEQAVQEQQAYQAATVPAAEPAPMDYDAQLKKLQESSMVKVKEKELKIAERMNKLQVRFANIRK
ncbi:hypothetical protein [Chryseobacterium sp. JUb7]|uniref:hypothetical protein n=1 Tax=Chryseobacterium sp. JUb7 TaxID=2940599 RepID=UPI0021674677|nr:hypothetical protein [Chryseobacterium sp. JUb7]MCS3528670.1 hypothetical protein [Chryseobacterium sp. JUb7]